MTYRSPRPPAPAHRSAGSRPSVSEPASERPSGPVDAGLLRGFRFACQPNCGLCCFATPQLRPTERTRLLRLDPAVVLEESPEGWTGIALQGPGGACSLLDDYRCRFHADRPLPCRLYPIHLHAGLRVQATLVLSCPGVDLAGLAASGPAASLPADSDDGLGTERQTIAALTQTPDFPTVVAEAQADHDRLRRRSRGVSHPGEEARARVRWASRPPAIRSGDFPAPAGPSEEDGLESLPIFHDRAHGIVAIAETAGGIDLLALDPRGGVKDRIGTYPLPVRRPALEPAAATLLSGYLGHLALRDAFADAVRFRWWEEGDAVGFLELFEEELRNAGTTVLARSTLRAMLAGRPGGVLDAAAVAEGIRATDAELLDQPVVGRNL